MDTGCLPGVIVATIFTMLIFFYKNDNNTACFIINAFS